MAAQTEAEAVETHKMVVQTDVETIEMKDLEVEIEEEEAMDNILNVETQDATTQLEAAELQEMEEAMQQINLGKALELDGFTSNFFHYLWDLIKKSPKNCCRVGPISRGSNGFQCDLTKTHPQIRRSGWAS